MTEAELQELLTLRTTVKELREALEMRRMRRRQLEAETLIKVIDARLPGRTFSGDDLLSMDDPVMRAALQAVGVDTPRKVGALLRDMSGFDVGGLRVQPCKRDRRGWTWTVARPKDACRQ